MKKKKIMRCTAELHAMMTTVLYIFQIRRALMVPQEAQTTEIQEADVAGSTYMFKI